MTPTPSIAFLLLLLLSLTAWRTVLWRPRVLRGVSRSTPWLIGHRGVRGSAPENTVAAFRLAFEAGLDGVECDVQQTSDGELVLFHDKGMGEAVITETTFAELRRLVPDIARLSDLFELAQEYPGTILNVELKMYGRRHRRGHRGFYRRVDRVIRKYGLADRVLISSFDPVALLRMRLLAPDLRAALIYEPQLPRLLRDGALAGWLHVDAIHPHHSTVDSGTVERAASRSLAINTWTVNDEREVQRLLALGVDGVVGDVPPTLKRAAGR